LDLNTKRRIIQIGTRTDIDGERKGGAAAAAAALAESPSETAGRLTSRCRELKFLE
jgi:hypothetical protein